MTIECPWKSWETNPWSKVLFYFHFQYPNSTQNPLDNIELALLVSLIIGETNNNIWINATTATEIQAELNLKKKNLLLEEQNPKEFHEFLDIFSKEKSARFPDSWP